VEIGYVEMKQLVQKLMNNDLFVFLMIGVFAYTAMTAVIIGVLQVPADAILDSGLDQVLLVFEEYPDND
jgi:hypothetical protein